MKRLIVFITLCLYGQAFCPCRAEQDPKDPRFLDLSRRTLPPTKAISNSGNASPAGAVNTNGDAMLERAGTIDFPEERQKLGPGDRITYRVIEDEDEPRSLTITDSGELEVPYLGLVAAAGKTSQQLAKDVKALLEVKLYYQASVIIAVELVNKTRVTGKVYVTGQVRNKGGFEIPAGETLTVSKAILNAGGFSDFSDKKNVHLVRKVGTDKQTYTVNVLNIWEKGKLEEDLVVQPGDLIVVPARLVNY